MAHRGGCTLYGSQVIPRDSGRHIGAKRAAPATNVAFSPTDLTSAVAMAAPTQPMGVAMAQQVGTTPLVNAPVAVVSRLVPQTPNQVAHLFPSGTQAAACAMAAFMAAALVSSG